MLENRAKKKLTEEQLEVLPLKNPVMDSDFGGELCLISRMCNNFVIASAPPLALGPGP